MQAAIDLHFSAIANQTNENMRILAIITAIFAPLTLLTGVYGMNFEFIPGSKVSNRVLDHVGYHADDHDSTTVLFLSTAFGRPW